MNLEGTENSQWEGEQPTSLATDLVDKGIVKEGTHILDMGCRRRWSVSQKNGYGINSRLGIRNRRTCIKEKNITNYPMNKRIQIINPTIPNVDSTQPPMAYKT